MTPFPRPSRPASRPTPPPVPLPDASPVRNPEQYWSRLGRALLLMTAAVALHGWLLRPADGPPGSAVRSLPSPAVASSASLVGGIAAPAAAERARDAVSLRFDIVRAERLERRPLTDAQLASAVPAPVGTGGPASTVPQVMAAAAIDAPAVSREPEEAVSAKNDSAPAESPLALTAAHLQGTTAPRELPGLTAPPLAGITRLSAPLEPAAAARVVSAAAKAPEAGADLSGQKQIVLQILQEYQQAFQRLDVGAAKAVWPSLDDRKLRRAFQQLDGQELRFASCDVVSISGRDANASCRGDLTYRPKVGSRAMTLTAREWTFNLSRADAGWQIVNATIH